MYVDVLYNPARHTPARCVHIQAEQTLEDPLFQHCIEQFTVSNSVEFREVVIASHTQHKCYVQGGLLSKVGFKACDYFCDVVDVMPRNLLQNNVEWMAKGAVCLSWPAIADHEQVQDNSVYVT